MAVDVLGGNAGRALLERLGVPGVFFFRKLPFGMTVEVSAVAGESEHEQKLRVHAWRGHASFRQRLNRQLQSLTEGHATIVITKGDGSRRAEFIPECRSVSDRISTLCSVFLFRKQRSHSHSIFQHISTRMRGFRTGCGYFFHRLRTQPARSKLGALRDEIRGSSAARKRKRIGEC